MKLLKVRATGFKNGEDDFSIDLVAKSKKTSEDKEYELQEIAEDLYTFNTIAFVGKNASGKTTAVELLDCCYSLLGEFRLEDKHYSFDNVDLEMHFYHDGYIYRYTTEIRADNLLGNRASFYQQHLFRKKYYKTNIKSIFDDSAFYEMSEFSALPEDTSILFFVLKKKATHALYFDSFGDGINTYQMVFNAMKNYNIGFETFLNVIRIFDENIKSLERMDEHNYKLMYQNELKMVSDKELLYFLSSGTTKGLLLYILMAASLKNGFDLLVDEIENHFHKTLVENMISLYKDKNVNRKNASLIFTTHYCELLDLFNRRDNIWISKADNEVHLENMYDNYEVRSELLKSRQFYNNVFQTSVNYDELMNLKRELMK